MYSYETIIELSFKMKKSTLPDEAIAKLNNIRKMLNIPVVEIIKKTVIQKKQSEIAQITKILNKMTENNYEKLKVELFELVKSIENIEDIHKITNTIFNIVSINVFYSKFFSKLYTELIPLNKEFFFVFQGHYDSYLNELNDKNNNLKLMNSIDEAKYIHSQIIDTESAIKFLTNKQQLKRSDIIDKKFSGLVQLETKLYNYNFKNQVIKELEDIYYQPYN